jgi:hypothetical protein
MNSRISKVLREGTLSGEKLLEKQLFEPMPLNNVLVDHICSKLVYKKISYNLPQ